MPNRAPTTYIQAGRERERETSARETHSSQSERWPEGFGFHWHFHRTDSSVRALRRPCRWRCHRLCLGRDNSRRDEKGRVSEGAGLKGLRERYPKAKSHYWQLKRERGRVREESHQGHALSRAIGRLVLAVRRATEEKVKREMHQRKLAAKTISALKSR